jgi:hypothetical protein
MGTTEIVVEPDDTALPRAETVHAPALVGVHASDPKP